MTLGLSAGLGFSRGGGVGGLGPQLFSLSQSLFDIAWDSYSGLTTIKDDGLGNNYLNVLTDGAGAASGAVITMTLDIGEAYVMDYEILANRTAGQVLRVNGSEPLVTMPATVGIHRVEFFAKGTPYIGIIRHGGFTDVDVDNVYLRKVL